MIKNLTMPTIHHVWTVESVQTMLPDVQVYHVATRQTIRGTTARKSDTLAYVYFQDTPDHVARIDVSWSQIALALNNATPLTA